MFNVGFSELCLVLLIILVVFGPKRLCELAERLGHWSAKIKKIIQGVKSEIAKLDAPKDEKQLKDE